MTTVVLRSFQQLSRVAQLEVEGVLVGDWDHVDPAFRGSYRLMVEAMARAGVDTCGRPPVWAWRGSVLLQDAALLLDPEHQLSTGYATVEFEAPTALVVASDYGAWNDHLAAALSGEPVQRELAAPRRGGSAVRGPEQVCLPHLRAEWVRAVRPLPTAGWDRLDLSRPA